MTELRNQYIGGSDVGAILGLSKWDTPLSLFQKKKGIWPQEGSNLALEVGTALEPWIADKYCEQTNLDILRHPPLQVHPEFNFLGGNLDAWHEPSKTVIEFKTARNKKIWDEQGVPLTYICQVSHYLACTDFSKAHLFVYFIDKNELELFTIHRNKQNEEQIIKACKDWWENYFLKDIPPEPTTFEEVKSYFQMQEGASIVADSATLTAVQKLRSVKDAIKSLENEEEDLKKQIMLYMQENEFLTDGSSKLLRWKTVETNRLDTKALKAAHPDLVSKFTKPSSYRRFF